MTRRLTLAFTLIALSVGAISAGAQQAPRARPAATSRSIQIGGYGMVGRLNLVARETFEAVIGKRSGPVFGGGANIGLPLGGLYVDMGGWRFQQEGERVFVTGSEVFKLGVPLTVTLTAVELTAGWRFRLRYARLVPYVGGGFTSYGYEESSSFAGPTEDVDERFKGYHLVGGAQFKVRRWLGIGAEFVWTTIPDALGTGGVSQAFGDTNLGGTSLRAKITIGR